eukprot:3736671-Pleurochrysis_carterae.AAC.2
MEAYASLKTRVRLAIVLGPQCTPTLAMTISRGVSHFAATERPSEALSDGILLFDATVMHRRALPRKMQWKVQQAIHAEVVFH